MTSELPIRCGVDGRRSTGYFDAALDRPTTERRSFVESECGDDSELLASVLRLLEIEEGSDDRLEVPDPTCRRHFIEQLAAVARSRLGQIDRYSLLARARPRRDGHRLSGRARG